MRRLLRPLIAALAAVAGLFAIMATTGAFGGSDGGVASAASACTADRDTACCSSPKAAPPNATQTGRRVRPLLSYGYWANTL